MTSQQLKQVKLIPLLSGLLLLSACSMITPQETLDINSKIKESSEIQCSNLSSFSFIKNGAINCAQTELDAINPPDSI